MMKITDTEEEKQEEDFTPVPPRIVEGYKLV